jgi:hypothetical protein
MSDNELFYWMAFSALEPFGDDRADWHSAMSLAQQANMNRKNGKAAYKPEKFLLKFKSGRAGGQSMAQMENALKAQYFAMGGKAH